MLGDFGAEVIKIEAPDGGDQLRARRRERGREREAHAARVGLERGLHPAGRVARRAGAHGAPDGEAAHVLDARDRALGQEAQQPRRVVRLAVAERDAHAVAVARRLEIPGVSTVIQEYNLLEREPYETDIAPIAFAQDLGVLARMPLASGYLRGDFRSKHDRPASPLFTGALRYVNRRGQAVLAVLDQIAYEVGHHVGRVALAWLLSKPMVTAPLVRVPNARGLADLMPASGLMLTSEQVARLDAVSER
jgi:aryl-alcohol dehydrogenase-like predicted oxidoreductase